MCRLCDDLYFFKQKTQYVLRISALSSDVYSSDLPPTAPISTASAPLQAPRVLPGRGEPAVSMAAPPKSRVSNRRSRPQWSDSSSRHLTASADTSGPASSEDRRVGKE